MILFLATGCGSTPQANRSSAGGAGPDPHTRFSASPAVVLWAWERPENLSFIDPQKVGVSYLVKTVQLEGDSVIVRPNLNALRVPTGTMLMACARIETNAGVPPSLSRRQLDRTAGELASLATFPNATAVQIDFDATASQRGFYRDLLSELRGLLPSSVPLSITALGSWCMGDGWISRLPVDEAVPMLFRMGPDRVSILQQLESGDDFAEPLCRESVGISTDELLPRLADGRRKYIFAPNSWKGATFAKLVNTK